MTSLRPSSTSDAIWLYAFLPCSRSVSTRTPATRSRTSATPTCWQAANSQYGVVDTVHHLGSALDRLGRIDPKPQALVFTGDLADRGEPDAYRQLREMVEPFAERIGARVVWCMGNHDDREAYARGLFDADAVTRRARPGATTSTGCASSRSTPACRATTTARSHDAQYAWLADGAGRAGAARHVPGDAPPADPDPDAAGRGDHRARRPAAAGRRRWPAPTSG